VDPPVLIALGVAVITAISAVAVALIKRPNKAELNGLRAKTDLDQQLGLAKANETIVQQAEQLRKMSDELSKARAKCTCEAFDKEKSK